MKIRTLGMEYKVGLYSKIYYLASDRKWLQSSEQEKIKSAIEVLVFLKNIGPTTRIKIQKILKWNTEKTQSICAWLKSNDLIYSVKDTIFIKEQARKDIISA